MHKENKNNDFIQQFVSSSSPYSAISESVTYVNNVYILTGNAWFWKLEHSSTQSWRRFGQKCVVYQLCCKSWINH